jgi:hypothetical protein
MSCMESFKCYHQGNKDWLSAVVQAAIKNNRLKVSKDALICDTKVPISVDLFNGQSLDCVGPKDSKCPHPDHAQIIKIEDIQ